jgi:hypothetical protein
MKALEYKPKVHATHEIFTRKPKTKGKNCKWELILGSKHGKICQENTLKWIEFQNYVFST